MQLKLPEKAVTILNKTTAAGFGAYVVGGAVRDLLLGREVKDWDFTTDARPEEILKIFPEGFYNNKFGTVGVPADAVLRTHQRTETPGSGSGQARMTRPVLEITTMRREGQYEDFRHPQQVLWTDKIEEDLARRDFTINAMALTVNGTLIDLYGGQNDIQARVIRAVGDPNLRFQEDALRILKAFRMVSELEFDIDRDTFAAIKKHQGLIRQISWERIRDELFKLLPGVNPYIGLAGMREAGILQIILPELERCFGLIQEGPKHDRVYDIGQHSLLSLKFCPSTHPLVRFATLIHDVGKPDTVNIGQDGNVTFYGHDIVGGKIAEKICNRLRLSKRETEKVYRLVRWHLFTVDENQTDSAIRRFIKNVGLENVDDMMALRVGDRLGGGTQKAVSWRMKEFRERIDQVLEKPFSLTDLAVNGRDVMEVLNIKPGKKVGEVLNRLFQEVLGDAGKNNRDYLLKRIRELP